MIPIKVLIGVLFLGACSSPKPPNIILIMGDDIGFSDLGCYGSEIKTPNLDRLADDGIRFTTFYNASKCETTRSTLLTGLYRGNDRAVNIAEILGSNGYSTIHAGKEHFTEWVPATSYAENAFDRSFTFWAANEFHIPPDSTFHRPFFINGIQTKAYDIQVENPPFFKTDVITDYALRWLNDQQTTGKPFFLYLPYGAAHYPLQAKAQDIAKYRGTYRAGWDTIRKERFQRQKDLGLLGPNYQLSPPSDNINQFRGHPPGDEERRSLIPLYRPWEELGQLEQDELDLEMAVFAAMTDCMDQNIGRVIDWLKQNGQFENTIIMYLSDNGSCPYDSNRDFDYPPGPAGGFRTLCAAWANVGNTPFKYFKQFGHEGGGRTHFIIHWPGKTDGGKITDQIGHISDIYPTILEMAGVEYPDEFQEVKTIPLHGSSLIPVINGKQRRQPEFIISGFSERFRMFRKGNLKLVRANEEAWELYDLENDPTELTDLGPGKPEKTSELLKNYLEIRAHFDSLENETSEESPLTISKRE